MIFCKSGNFLQETEETLNSHVKFINSVFNVHLKKMGKHHGLPWFVSLELPEILYFSGHTNDAIKLLERLHFLCEFGYGTQIKSVYLNTCSAKNADCTNGQDKNSVSKFLLSIDDATEEEKKMLNIGNSAKFVSLDSAIDKIKADTFSVYLCKQDSPVDEKVKMARFLPMDECGLGFSPTSSELLLHPPKVSLCEKLKDAFDCLHECRADESGID